MQPQQMNDHYYMTVIRGLQHQINHLQQNQNSQSNLAGKSSNGSSDEFRKNSQSGMEISQISIQDNLADRGKVKYMSEKNSKVQTDNKCESRGEEQKRNFFQTKGNAHSRLSEWKCSNTPSNFRKKQGKEMDKLVVTMDQIEDEEPKFRKKAGGSH